jgi:hypothetical protein
MSLSVLFVAIKINQKYRDRVDERMVCCISPLNTI